MSKAALMVLMMMLVAASGAIAQLPDLPSDPYVDVTGDTMTGDLSMGENSIVLSGGALNATAKGGLMWQGQPVCVEAAIACRNPWQAATGGIAYEGGNVGIGTSTPQGRVHIVTSPAGGDVLLETTDAYSSADPGITLCKNTTSGAGPRAFWLGVRAHHDQRFDIADLGQSGCHPGSAPVRFTIDRDGDVGIGTTAPTARLDVQGDARWTGELVAGSVPWQRVTSMPEPCPSGQFVTGLGPALECADVGNSMSEIPTLLVRNGVTYTLVETHVWEENEHVYARVTADAGINWMHARDAARAFGGHLTTITSGAEQTMLEDQFLAGLAGGNAWIGFTDARQEGVWEWVTGEIGPIGENSVYTHWGAGEPGGDGDGAFFVQGDWHDLNMGRTDVVSQLLFEIAATQSGG